MNHINASLIRKFEALIRVQEIKLKDAVEQEASEEAIQLVKDTLLELEVILSDLKSKQ